MNTDPEFERDVVEDYERFCLINSMGEYLYRVNRDGSLSFTLNPRIAYSENYRERIEKNARELNLIIIRIH